MNCIYNATYNGTCLDGTSLFVYGLPVCSDCAKGIIQVGIKLVAVRYPHENIPEKWEESWNLTKDMFDEAGVNWFMCKGLSQ